MVLVMVNLKINVTQLREKGRDLTQSYDKKPLHQQKCQKGKVATQTTPQKVRLHSGCGPT